MQHVCEDLPACRPVMTWVILQGTGADSVPDGDLFDCGYLVGQEKGCWTLPVTSYFLLPHGTCPMCIYIYNYIYTVYVYIHSYRMILECVLH